MTMITDIHRHFVPAAFFDYVCRRPEFQVVIKCREGDRVDADIRGRHFGLNTTFFDLGKQFEQMNREGVERAVLSLATPFIDYNHDGDFALETAIRFNDALAEAIAADPKRCRAWAFLPMQDPQAAAEELRRCVRQYGFIGGHIASNVRGVYLHDPCFEPVLRAALELNVPLFVHPADPAGKDRTGDYELTVVAGYLFDSTINILRMICSGFLDRWPNLKLVCAHTGAFSLALRARMQREVDTNPSIAANLKRPVGEYLRRLYFDSVCFEPRMLQYAMDVVPPEHIMLGSDAPFPLGEVDPVGFVRRALPSDQAKAILSRNLDRLLEA
jgi:aminocarboxymuconate-semialdehyde decarboxylase